jgi:SMC interacting uncharacterized protein involved in chromosome segregation
MLTDAQELQINSVEKYTHDYEAEAMQSFDATGDDIDDKMEELQARFEAEIVFDTEDDIGGIVTYFKADELVAFYDYENFRGAVFA